MAKKKRASLGAEDLKPGLRFKYGAFYGRPSVSVKILRDREHGTGAFGLPRDRWWSKDLGTGKEGYIVLGLGGRLNIDEVLGSSVKSRTKRHHATKKKSPAQLQREIDEALAGTEIKPISESSYLGGLRHKTESYGPGGTRSIAETPGTSTKIWQRVDWKAPGAIEPLKYSWKLVRPHVRADEVEEWLKIYRDDHPGVVFVASPTKPRGKKGPKIMTGPGSSY